jgi:two-component system, OmpR family, alkaline phosphatase synthesis response regulator PhoP
MHILVVEDNRNLARGIRHNLTLEGYSVDVAHDGTSGLARARAGDVDLVILDLMIPKPDGLHILRTLREEGVETPVLVLTALGTEADKLRGFRLGADEYLTKPFRVMELIARTEAILRRRGPARAPSAAPRRAALERTPAPIVEFGDVRIEPDAHSVYRGDRPIALRPREFDLLMALVRRGGAVASRLALLNEVWGTERDVVRRTVDTHIWELRRKLEHDPTRPKHILTVRKTGYRLEP